MKQAVRTRKTAQRVQTAILQDLRQTLGVEATLPETAVKDLVLQVIYLRIYPFSIIPTYITEISFSLHNLQPFGKFGKL